MAMFFRNLGLNFSEIVMVKIVVASRNPVKMEAVKESLAVLIPEEINLIGVSVESGVPDQPMNDAETLRGAENRVENAKLQFPGNDFYVGVEGGVEDSDSGLMAFAWIVISNHQQTGKARTAGFFLPPKVAELVHAGMELGHADDIVFKKENSKQQNGAVGLLTNDTITGKPCICLQFKWHLFRF